MCNTWLVIIELLEITLEGMLLPMPASTSFNVKDFAETICSKIGGGLSVCFGGKIFNGFFSVLDVGGSYNISRFGSKFVVWRRFFPDFDRVDFKSSSVRAKNISLTSRKW